MSNIYIQEPPTHGKLILKTSVGEIELELWSKEAPKACRNFVQLCLEGYYNNTIFHRVLPGFIVQGGDPTGTGEGGESIYGEPFKDEFHQRLRFSRRGLVAMASNSKDNNNSQFFFTFNPCTELQKKHTIFAKVAGNTIYNMVKLEEGELIDERPVKPHKIISTEVIVNPFDDIVPRNLKQAEVRIEKVDKSREKGVKNYGLLSFGDEADEDDDEIGISVMKKVKSAHDIGDPTLIAKKVIEDEHEDDGPDKSENEDEPEIVTEDKTASTVDYDRLKSKLKKTATEQKPKPRVVDEDVDEKKLKSQQLKEEIKKLRKELVDSSKQKKEDETKKQNEEVKKTEEIEIVKKYKEDVDKYEHLKRKKLMNEKEAKTLELLNSFRERLFNAKSQQEATEATATDTQVTSSSNEFNSILTHKLELDEEVKQKVIDANVSELERFSIFDPRNVLNKRKREMSKEIIKDRKKR